MQMDDPANKPSPPRPTPFNPIPRERFEGGGFQKLINNADDDDELSHVVKSARYHGLHVPRHLNDVEGYAKGGRAKRGRRVEGKKPKKRMDRKP